MDDYNKILLISNHKFCEGYYTLTQKQLNCFNEYRIKYKKDFGEDILDFMGDVELIESTPITLFGKSYYNRYEIRRNYTENQMLTLVNNPLSFNEIISVVMDSINFYDEFPNISKEDLINEKVCFYGPSFRNPEKLHVSYFPTNECFQPFMRRQLIENGVKLPLCAPNKHHSSFLNFHHNGQRVLCTGMFIPKEYHDAYWRYINADGPEHKNIATFCRDMNLLDKEIFYINPDTLYGYGVKESEFLEKLYEVAKEKENTANGNKTEKEST